MAASITDFSQFSGLRAAAQRNDPAALREVAGQFEALFIQTMLKSMRDASIEDPLFGASEQQKMFEGMLDQQLALEMSSGKGIGLAEMLVRQMAGDGEVTRESALQLPKVVRSVARKLEPLWTDAKSFAEAVWPHARRAAQKLNVAPEAVLAQAALETGWGEYVPERRDGRSSLNLFGIKAGNGWTGASAVKPTLEFDAGIARTERAAFRAYKDIAATFDDYAQLLSENPRYANVSNHGDDVEGFAKALQSSGYATDPSYAEKIKSIAAGKTMRTVLGVLKSAIATPIQAVAPDRSE